MAGYLMQALLALTHCAHDIIKFSTEHGHWQYELLLFGLYDAAATFQWLMEIILRNHRPYAPAYLVDVRSTLVARRIIFTTGNRY